MSHFESQQLGYKCESYKKKKYAEEKKKSIIIKHVCIKGASSCGADNDVNIHDGLSFVKKAVMYMYMYMYIFLTAESSSYQSTSCEQNKRFSCRIIFCKNTK